MNKTKFKLTNQHIQLLKASYVVWDDSCYNGVATIDIKRPYGNKTILCDIHEMFSGVRYYDDRELSEKNRKKYVKLHRETEIALQIVLTTGTFEPGIYQKRHFYSGWEKIV